MINKNNELRMLENYIPYHSIKVLISYQNLSNLDPRKQYNTFYVELYIYLRINFKCFNLIYKKRNFIKQ